MYIIAELTGVVTEILLAHIYLNGFFTQRLRPRWAMLAAYIMSGGILAILSFVPDASFLRLAFYVVALGLIVYSFFNASILQAVYASISYCCLCVLNEMLIFGLFSLFHIDAQAIMAYGHTRHLHYYFPYVTMALCLDRASNYETKKNCNYLTIPSHFDTWIYCWNCIGAFFLPTGARR